MREGGFDATDHELQCVEMDQDLCTTPEFPYNWMYDGTKPDRAFFELTITCRALFLIFQEKETAAHTVRIQMSGENLDKKFTILGFGYVE